MKMLFNEEDLKYLNAAEIITPIVRKDLCEQCLVYAMCEKVCPEFSKIRHSMVEELEE